MSRIPMTSTVQKIVTSNQSLRPSVVDSGSRLTGLLPAIKIAVQTGTCAVAPGSTGAAAKIMATIGTTAGAVAGMGASSVVQSQQKFITRAPRQSHEPPDLKPAASRSVGPLPNVQIAAQTGVCSAAISGRGNAAVVVAENPPPRIIRAPYQAHTAEQLPPSFSFGPIFTFPAQAALLSPIARATEKKIAILTGASFAGIAGSVVSKKSAVERGSTATGAASSAAVVKVAVQTGRCSVGAAGSGGSSKVATSRGISANAFCVRTINSSTVQAVVSGQGHAGAAATGKSVKVAIQTGRCAVGAAGAAGSAKRCVQVARCAAGIDGSSAVGKVSLQVASCSIGATGDGVDFKISATAGAGGVCRLNVSMVVRPSKISTGQLAVCRTVIVGLTQPRKVAIVPGSISAVEVGYVSPGKNITTIGSGYVALTMWARIGLRRIVRLTGGRRGHSGVTGGERNTVGGMRGGSPL